MSASKPHKSYSCSSYPIGLVAILVQSFLIVNSSAWSLSSSSRRMPISNLHPTQIPTSSYSIDNKIRIDTEGPVVPFAIPTSLRKLSRLSRLPPNRFPEGHFSTIAEKPKEGLYGTPWTSSFVEDATTDCIYMPFWEWQLNRMQEDLTNFEILEDTSCYLESPAGQHRMVTLTASSDEYRYIRMTYMDGGDKVQIFTSVMYPRGNHPLFGLDLLQFQNGKRNLAICDFQPLHSEEEDHDVDYERALKLIRQSTPSLQEEMSNRFFDPSQYFSPHTLLGRFADVEDPQVPIWNELWPAYQAYFQAHIQMVQKKSSRSSKQETLTPEEVLEHHRRYDNYIAERDPAHPMFSSIFGSDVAENYVYDVLFPLAEKPETK